MKAIGLTVGLLLLTIGPLFAQLNILTNYRSVSVSGYARASSDTDFPAYGIIDEYLGQGSYSALVSSNASHISRGTGPYGLDITAYSRSRASQQSAISASAISLSSDLRAETWSDLSGWGGRPYAYAESLFQVVFNVSSPSLVEVAWNSWVFRQDYPMLDFGCRLSSAQDAPLVNITTSASYFGDPRIFTLSPGDLYTLNIFSWTSAATPDPFGELGSLQSQFSLTLIPEPSPLALLLLGLGAIFPGRWLRSHHHC
jgi:hypothetical protein